MCAPALMAGAAGPYLRQIRSGTAEDAPEPLPLLSPGQAESLSLEARLLRMQAAAGGEDGYLFSRPKWDRIKTTADAFDVSNAEERARLRDSRSGRGEAKYAETKRRLRTILMRGGLSDDPIGSAGFLLYPHSHLNKD